MNVDFFDILSLAGSLLLMVAIFIGAYYVTKMVGKQYDGSHSKSKSKIEILDRKALGKEQSLIVVKIADKVLLLGATPQSITKIESFDGEHFPIQSPQATEPINFLNVLKDTIQSSKKQTDKNKTDKNKTDKTQGNKKKPK